MSKMFDKYDSGPEFTPIKPFRRPVDHPRTIGSGAVKILKDIKGNEIGVEAPRGSIFSLYFTFSGDVDGISISEFLTESNLIFNIYDHRHNLVYQAPVEVDCNVAIANVISDGLDILPYGNYNIELILSTEDFEYIVINSHDLILSIN